MEGRSELIFSDGRECLLRHERPQAIFGDAYEGKLTGLFWYGFERLADSDGSRYWDGPIACAKTRRAACEQMGVDPAY